MMVEDELRRLRHGPRQDEKPTSLPVDYTVRCEGEAELVLLRARQVLEIVLQASPRSWPSLEEWQSLLPKWLVDASSCERSAKEEDEWEAWLKTLPREERVRAESGVKWSLGEYLTSFSPGGERWWRWWDGVVEDHGTLKVTVLALDLPLAWDELHWLLRAAGADEIYEAGWEEYEASQGN